ncbi:electron carrier/ protein disulfide oxidoreductase [Anaeramoeba flamelloides]|uniref:Electron carrier/ protein disulfide oxidoreductase n=1 Tax=Anaeramoeba flamelloides TaxID=1746091 RepID=A0AAV8A9H7_9EUKA|nr:electron carrier/ protein disulfide oxidoreductase [Anaeramoeba flamelloides]
MLVTKKRRKYSKSFISSFFVKKKKIKRSSSVISEKDRIARKIKALSQLLSELGNKKMELLNFQFYGTTPHKIKQTEKTIQKEELENKALKIELEMIKSTIQNINEQELEINFEPNSLTDQFQNISHNLEEKSTILSINKNEKIQIQEYDLDKDDEKQKWKLNEKGKENEKEKEKKKEIETETKFFQIKNNNQNIKPRTKKKKSYTKSLIGRELDNNLAIIEKEALLNQEKNMTNDIEIHELEIELEKVNKRKQIENKYQKLLDLEKHNDLSKFEEKIQIIEQLESKIETIKKRNDKQKVQELIDLNREKLKKKVNFTNKLLVELNVLKEKLKIENENNENYSKELESTKEGNESFVDEEKELEKYERKFHNLIISIKKVEFEIGNTKSVTKKFYSDRDKLQILEIKKYEQELERIKIQQETAVIIEVLESSKINSRNISENYSNEYLDSDLTESNESESTSNTNQGDVTLLIRKGDSNNPNDSERRKIKITTSHQNNNPKLNSKSSRSITKRNQKSDQKNLSQKHLTNVLLHSFSVEEIYQSKRFLNNKPKKVLRIKQITPRNSRHTKRKPKNLIRKKNNYFQDSNESIMRTIQLGKGLKDSNYNSDESKNDNNQNQVQKQYINIKQLQGKNIEFILNKTISNDDIEINQPQIRKKAKGIFYKYIKPGSLFEINIISSCRKTIIKNINQKRYFLDLFDEAQEAVFNHMNLNSWSSFQKTTIYMNLLKNLKNDLTIDLNQEKKRCVLIYNKKKKSSLNEEFVYRGKKNNAYQISEELMLILMDILNVHYSVNKKSIDMKAISKSIPFRKFVEISSKLQNINLKNLSVQERLSFFINIYNVLTLHSFVVNGVPKDKQNVERFLKNSVYRINDFNFSLNDIYHGILRGNTDPKQPNHNYFKSENDLTKSQLAIRPIDARVHFTLINYNFNSYIRVYYFNGLSENLSKVTKEMLLSLVTINHKKKKILIPKLFAQYEKDFGGPEKILKWISMNTFHELYFDSNENNLISNYSIKYVYKDMNQPSIIFDLKRTISRKFSKIKLFDEN